MLHLEIWSNGSTHDLLPNEVVLHSHWHSPEMLAFPFDWFKSEDSGFAVRKMTSTSYSNNSHLQYKVPSTAYTGSMN